MKSILITTNGYEINTQVFKCHEDAFEKMSEDYNSLMPDNNPSEFADECYICEDEATLYSRGEDVYLWKIIHA